MNTRRISQSIPPKGFTLIELVIVLVILAILAAIAVPKYVNLGRSSSLIALKQMAKNIEAGSETNLTAWELSSAHTGAIRTAQMDCKAVSKALLGSGSYDTKVFTIGAYMGANVPVNANIGSVGNYPTGAVDSVSCGINLTQYPTAGTLLLRIYVTN